MRISITKFFPLLLAVISSLTALGQNQFYSVSGKVTDANSNPLAGATVKIKDTYSGAITNAQGVYTLKSVAAGTVTLEVTFVGFNTQTKEVNVASDITNQNFTLTEGTIIAKDFVVLANKVNEKMPIAVQNIDSIYMAENNTGLDLPIILDQATSVVSTSDAGNGVGYTGMRIRGSDATRVNVTINGVPLNDPESQGTYFVNLPDFASSVDDIQIQRGIGTSMNGAGAFGGSVNINTTELQREAYGTYSFGMGSFNTMKNTLSFGSGLTNNGFAFDGRLSMIKSDGYIDRATSDLKSYFAKAGYYGKKFSAKFITFGGNERTYQAWNGVPFDYLNDENLRTYNIYDYKDQVDNYSQTHYQLHLNYDFNANWKATLSGFYVLGQGYFEEYKGDKYNQGSPQDFADYGLEDVIIGGDTITETNLIRRRWLDNTFGGALFNVQYTNNSLDLVIGGGYNEYDGDHFGEITWAEYASNSQKDQRYYENKGIKTDFNLYTKATYAVDDKLTVFGDLQYRVVDYKVSGIDNDQRVLSVDDNLQFINPKFGFVFEFNNESRAYASMAAASHEPSRGDYIDAAPGVTPRHESMIDIEGGYKYNSNKFTGSANLYYMDYNDQLVLTGAINDVGDAVRENVKSSYRAGVELELGYRFTKKLTWSLNTTLSQNKIKKYVNFTDDWYNGGQDSAILENTNISFSPNTILGSVISYKTPLFNDRDELGIALISKYVGEQYFDNTQSEDRKLDAYFTNDIRLTYVVSNIGVNTISFNFTARNVFNTLYVSNAWSYTFRYDDTGWDPSADDIYTNKTSEPGLYQMAGYFPQAGTNFMMGLTIDF